MLSSREEFLDRVARLTPIERAAAIGHRIYIMTAQQAGWTLRVAEEWEDLTPEARQYNVASIATWIQSPELLDQWIHALREAGVADPRSAQSEG
jgi:hypothetical protein